MARKQRRSAFGMYLAQRALVAATCLRRRLYAKSSLNLWPPASSVARPFLCRVRGRPRSGGHLPQTTDNQGDQRAHDGAADRAHDHSDERRPFGQALGNHMLLIARQDGGQPIFLLKKRARLEKPT